MSSGLIKIVDEYIKLGWNIIPVKEDKTPAVRSWKIYQEQRIDLSEFELFGKDKNYFGKIQGIALVTGKISGVTILDFDKGSKDLFEGINTPTVRTGGGGKHYYFKYTDKIQTSSNQTLKIDIRNDGGYAVMPPSKLIKGEYTWIKDFNTPLADLPDNFISDFTKEISKVSWDFDGVTEGNRNAIGIKVCGKLVSNFRNDLDLAYSSLVAWNSRNNPPLSEFEIKNIFNWVIKADKKNNSNLYGQSEKKENKKLSDFSIDELFNYEERELLNTGINDLDSKFKHPAGFYVICASPGVGKGFWALWLTRRFYELHQKKSVYFSLEMTTELIKRRILQCWSDLNEEEFNYYIKTDKSRFDSSIKLIKDGAIHIDEFGGSDTSGITPDNFKKKISEYYSEGYRVFHFDHLHELKGATVNDLNQKVIEDWAKTFQGLIKDFKDIWLFVFAQPNKSAYDKRILLKEDLMGSSSIAQKCEFFYSLNRTAEIDKDTNTLNIKNDTRDVIFYLDKNRVTSNSYVGFNLYFAKTGNFFSSKDINAYNNS